MREILFRGKRRADGVWVYGSLLKPGNGPHECSAIREPDPERRYGVFERTIGEYTGLNDENGTRIFEGDILTYQCSDGSKHYGVVEYGVWNCSCCHGVFGWACDGVDIRYHDTYTVAGNIHDNPELLRRDEE